MSRSPYRTSAEMVQLCLKLAEISHSVRTIAGQAEALGLEPHEVYLFRTKARLAGYDVRPVEHRKRPKESDKLAALDRSMNGPGCGKCSLHGPHECVSARSLAEARLSEAPSVGGVSGSVRPTDVRFAA